MKLQTFVLSPFQSNCYVLSETDENGAPTVVIDPGDLDVKRVMDYVSEHQYQVQAVWLTHGHIDHVMGVDVIRKAYDIPAYVHAADMDLWQSLPNDAARWLGKQVPALNAPDGFLEEGDTLACGNLSFKVWHTPGHSRGSVCLIGEEVAITGDTLFAQGVGRTDLPGGSFTELSHSLKRLLTLADNVRIYPGHMGTSTIGFERQVNPFLTDIE